MKHIVVLIAFVLAASLNSRAELFDSADLVVPLDLGATVPEAALRDAEGGPVLLSEALGGAKSVLVFFRGGWCPYCTKHLAALKDVLPALEEQGFRVIAISPDTVESNQGAADKNALPYPVLTDAAFEAIEAFGLAFTLDDETVETYKGYGFSLVAHPVTGRWVLPVPAVYLVDEAGVIRYQHYDNDYRERLDPTEILREASALLAQ
jgi:peroxiredoxin